MTEGYDDKMPFATTCVLSLWSSWDRVQQQKQTLPIMPEWQSERIRQTDKQTKRCEKAAETTSSSTMSKQAREGQIDPYTQFSHDDAMIDRTKTGQGFTRKQSKTVRP